jgi:hypothetical protein
MVNSSRNDTTIYIYFVVVGIVVMTNIYIFWIF